MTATYVTADQHDPFTPDTRTWHDLAACAAACRDPRDPARPSWWDVVAPDLTDPDDDHLAALDVCETCPVDDDCLADADLRRDAWSIRGGLLPADWRPARKRGAA